MRAVLACSLLALALSGCASKPRPGPTNFMIDRMLAGAPGEAQPSKIVAREIEFARAAREDGQWTAFRKFAAPGAVIHGRNGPIIADSWLAGQANPPEAVSWEPRTVWMSCTGEVAVSQGRFRDPQGIVGTFITVWKRQDNRDYQWVYDVGSPDDPQPPPKEPVEQGDIVVTAIDAVRAEIADCPKRGTEMPAAPAFSIAEDFSQGGEVSSDGTLRWRWEQRGPGERRFVIDYFVNGEWTVGLDQQMPSPVEEGEG